MAGAQAQAVPSSRKKFLKNLTVLVGGTASSRVIGILAAPILTRIYDPADFALLAVVVALASLFIPIASLSYEQAIAVSQRQSESDNLFIVSLLLPAVLGLVLVLVGFFFGDILATMLRNAELAAWIWAVPLFVVIRGWLKAGSYYCVRKSAFSLISAVAVAEALATAGAKLGAAHIWGASSATLLFGGLFGVTLGGVMFAIVIWFTTFRAVVKKVSVSGMLAGIKGYKEFPLFNSWTLLVNAVAENVVLLLFSGFFSPAIVGAYSLANRMVNMPAAYVGSNFSKAFLGHAAEHHRRGRALSRTLVQGTAALAGVGVVPFAALFLFGTEIFGFVFGSSWMTAGRYAEIIAPGLFFVLINKPAAATYSIYRKVRERLIYSVLYTIARVAGIVIGLMRFGDPAACLAILAAVMVIFNCFFIGFAYTFTLRGDSDVAEARDSQSLR